MMISSYVWFDGRLVHRSRATVPITTHAIHYGTSIFEGIRGYWNGDNLYIFRLDDHVRRFLESGMFYSIRSKYTAKQIGDAIISTCKKNRIKKSCYIRPVYFVGDYGISMHVTQKAPTHTAVFAFPMGRLFDGRGITTCISSWQKFSDSTRPPLAKMGGNYLNSILATQEAKRNGYDEAILLDQNGNISEAPGENVFLVKDGTLVTPDLDSSVLQGITRDTVMQIATDLGYRAESGTITRGQMYTADEIFLTGTAAEITPVSAIDHKKMRAGRITKEISARYYDIVMNRDDRYSGWLTAVY